MTTTCESWTIQYANDDRPTIKVFGTREEAEVTAKKRNKYQESYVIAEAPKVNYEIEKEKALAEAIKYGLKCDL